MVKGKSGGKGKSRKAKGKSGAMGKDGNKIRQQMDTWLFFGNLGCILCNSYLRKIHICYAYVACRIRNIIFIGVNVNLFTSRCIMSFASCLI